jgi:hypothetical protein
MSKAATRDKDAAPAKPAAAPAKPAAATAKAAAPAAKPAPSVHVYSRQKDQHVVGPGCWCFPKVEVVDGQKIIVHKRS